MRCDLDFWEQFAAIFKDEWREFAACIDTPEYIFLDPEYSEQAQRVCDQCPVSRDCIDNAIYFDDGGHRGMSEKERGSIIGHRKRNIKAFHHDLGMLDE